MYTLDEKVCIWLSSFERLTIYKALTLFENLKTPEAIWNNFTEKENELKIFLTEELYNKMKLSRTIEYVDQIIMLCEREGVEIITRYSSKYPQRLVNIADPPLALYCLGNTDILNNRCISVVGSRKNSAYGKRVTNNFTSFFVDEGYTIVSGLAIGIDTIAHEKTLEKGGLTIAVLGSGVKNIYPSSNMSLAKRIVDSGGALISEYLPYAKPLQYNFPKRNRLVSALSQALFISEAGLSSGVHSTLTSAFDQGISPFTVPGEIYNYSSMGSNQMIKSYNGMIVTSPEDVVENIGVKYKVKTKRKVIQLDFNSQLVVNCLKVGEKHFNDIKDETTLDIGELTYILASLELNNIITKLSSNNYVLNTEAFR